MSDVGREIPVGDEQLPTKERKKYERKPTVRFTVEEARLIENALNSYIRYLLWYDGRSKDHEAELLVKKLNERARKFIEKFGTKEAT